MHKQAISDDLQNIVCLLPALKNKALTNSGEPWHNTFFRTPKRQAVGSEPSGAPVGHSPKEKTRRTSQSKQAAGKSASKARCAY